MLIGFSVSNFMSFNSTQSISLQASKITRHKDHIISGGPKKILKSGLIFGANAGGKSNLVKALAFSNDIIINGLDAVDINKKHFRLNSDNYKQPGVFEYRLCIDGIEYSYGIVISYSNKEIVSEWLVRIDKDGTETYIYNRELDDEGISNVNSEILYLSDEEQIRLNVYLEDFGENISDTLRKKSILSDISLRSTNKNGIFFEIKQVFEWFQKMIILFPDSIFTRLNEVVANDATRDFFGNILSSFDTGIQSIERRNEKIDLDKIFERLPKEFSDRIKTDISNTPKDIPFVFRIGTQVYSLIQDEDGNFISTKMLLNHGSSEDLFEYADESDGTKRLFDLVPLFFGNCRDCVIVIDEIDRSLHTKLTKRFLEIFYELTSTTNAQIIATTHASNLLDQDLIRQDEIWFVERQDDHSSKIYSLNMFKERFDKKIDKEYLLGRYGAIPLFNESDLEDMND